MFDRLPILLRLRRSRVVKSRTVKEISQDLYLVRTETTSSLTYELDCAKYKRVSFTIDFTGSSNLELSTGGLTLTTSVNPYEKREVAYLVVPNPALPWTLKVKYSWEEEDPDTAPSGAPKREELSKDIFVYTTRREHPTAFTYEVFVAKYKKVHFLADFTGSVNLRLSTGGLSQRTVVKPYEKKGVAHLMVIDPTMPWTLKVTYNWEEEDAEASQSTAPKREQIAPDVFLYVRGRRNMGEWERRIG